MTIALKNQEILEKFAENPESIQSYKQIVDVIEQADANAQAHCQKQYMEWVKEQCDIIMHTGGQDTDIVRLLKILVDKK